MVALDMVEQRFSRNVDDLKKLKTFEERFNYLKLQGAVGEETFGYDRIFNQLLYSSTKWRSARDKVIIRDNGCDLGVDGYDIHGRVMVHHINPITMDDIIKDSYILYDPENLITTTHATHNAIHYSDETILMKGPVERSKNDTCPWKK